MDTSRMSQGQMIAGASGVLLFIFLFLPWFGAGDESESGWFQTTFDIYLLITAAVAVLAAVTAGGQMKLFGSTMDAAAALLGAVALICLLTLLTFDFPDGIDRKIGLFLAVIAAAGIAYGGSQAAAGDVGVDRDRERF